MEWKPAKQFQVGGGLFIVPFSRNGLQSTLSYITLDVSPIATVSNSSRNRARCATSVFSSRDSSPTSVCQYRVGAFDGQRDANSHSSLRTTGYLQYDFFDRETGYLFTGTALGQREDLSGGRRF